MSNSVTYYPGGFQAAAPQQNRASLADGTAGTFTTWDAAGVQTSTRALTAQEAADLAAQDTAQTAGTNQATLRQQAQTALTSNRTFIGLATPSTSMTLAQQQQLWNQVKALTQQHQALIRLALQQFDATN